jgi:hypothetical protein
MRPATGRGRGMPEHQMAACSAVMTVFTHPALSAASLGTRYRNPVFRVERGSSGEPGRLMRVVTLVGRDMPVAAALMVTPWSRRPSPGTLLELKGTAV